MKFNPLAKVSIKIVSTATAEVVATKHVTKPHNLATLNPHALRLMDRHGIDQRYSNVIITDTDTDEVLSTLDPFYW